MPVSFLDVIPRLLVPDMFQPNGGDFSDTFSVVDVVTLLFTDTSSNAMENA